MQLDRFSSDASIVRLQLGTKVRPFRLRSKGSLIAATVLLQAAVIGLGWFLTLHFAHKGISDRTQARVLDENAKHVAHFDAMLTREVGGPIELGTPEWEKAQSLVEGYKLPGGAFLFLLDDDGRVICHPALRTNMNLRRVDYSEQVIILGEGTAPLCLGDLSPGAILTGETDFLGGPVALAITYNPQVRAKVLVHQPEAGLLAATRHVTEGLSLMCGLAGLLVLGVTVAGSVLLVRRYDTILMRANQQLEEEVERRTRRGLAIRNGLIFGLAKLADYRDTDTGKHLERICRYCELLATQLLGRFEEIDKSWIDLLKLASSMHDIGKVGIPDSILLKPGAFTPEERRLMEVHPLIGADTLVAIRRRVGDDDLLNMGIQVTLSHHERYDGKGYPYGLSDDQIPLSARIVALADMYDALTSKRVYKAAMSHAQACAIIRECRGNHFDPAVADAFLRITDQFNQIRLELQPEGAPVERPALQEAVDRAAETRRRLAA